MDPFVKEMGLQWDWGAWWVGPRAEPAAVGGAKGRANSLWLESRMGGPGVG